MIYFVRHGSTNWNDNVNSEGKKDPKCQGRADIPLNENGIKEAQAVAESLKTINFDKVFCSPLTRTKQTCEIICKDKSKIQIEPRLIERDFGEFEGLTRHEFDFFDFCDFFSTTKYKKAESLSDVRDRVFPFIEELKQYKNQNILVVSHGGVGCIFVSYFKGLPTDGDYSRFEIPHGKAICFDFET